MRIVTWNVQHGGGQRATRFAERLADFEADVVVVTEFRNNRSGAAISSILRENGLAHFSANDAAPRVNTVAIGAYRRFEPERLHELGADQHRCMRVEIDGISIFGLYFPQKKEKVPVFESICRLDTSVLASDSLLIGDFNTGRHFVDETGKTFYAAEYLDRLEQRGWVDAWRSRNPDRTEYSWYSHANNGFRVDHAFASKSLDQRIRRITYEHNVRENGLSDHSALVIDIDD